MATEYDDYDEIKEDGNDDPNEDDYVELYSTKAIFWFTFFFSTIFGGILLAINLKNAGQKRGALSVILFSIGYFVLTRIIGANILLSQQGNKLLPYIIIGTELVGNVIGGLILVKYYSDKYFPDKDYYPRSIMGPLLVGIIIYLLQTFIASQIGLQNLSGL
ncbi:hypothetical protein GCM10023149_42390 [Mucilaginibacter gynuensis]|uniref:Uncharacterized protein n=1 Tax=Mucilaginibacter gynuensis TaxID=1302236 RepID=A0ABP8H6F6_9SPHI